MRRNKNNKADRPQRCGGGPEREREVQRRAAARAPFALLGALALFSISTPFFQKRPHAPPPPLV
jgi:hypothetical protein